jgi:hypothetical protein
MVIVFNYRGLAMFAGAGAITFAIGELFGLSGEGPLMIVLGPLLAACDLVYRLKSKQGHWLDPHQGGSLFFLPAWCLGVFWFILGIIYTIQAATVSSTAAARGI